MWPFLPKKCDCSETPTNPGTSCNPSGLTTNDLVYDGSAGVCSNVATGMTASEAFQQLDYFLCSIELTQYILNQIENNPEEYPEFITLVNGAINCSTIDDCGPPPPPTTTTTSSSTSTSTTSTTSTSSTTTTTTTVAEACHVYNLTAITDNGNWTAELCFGGVVDGILAFAGNTVTTPCIINTSLVLNGITAVTNFVDCSITTTTTSSTSTSTSSTTTTSTTACPCNFITINILPGYIRFSPVEVTYTDCDGLPASQTYTEEGIYAGALCSPDIMSIIAYYTTPSGTLIADVFPVNDNEPCCGIVPVTTTTTTTPTPTCRSFAVFANFSTPAAFSYDPCGGGESINITLQYPSGEFPSAVVVCCAPLTVPFGPNVDDDKIDYTLIGECSV
jgi:hypothetical protein